MISSQLLLAGFIAYWLITRYGQERTQLKTELDHEILTAYDQQVDSLLMKHIIHPTLNDTLMLSVDLTSVRGTRPVIDSAHTSVVIRHLEADSMDTSGVSAFRTNDSTSLDEDRLVRSVKLFINETDAAFRTNAQTHAFSLQVDSSALLQMLYSRFLEKEWNFSVDWYRGAEAKLQGADSKGLILNTLTFNELPPLSIRHITPYLLGLMWPEFVLSLMLLSLSASALILAYRSLRKQVALNVLRNDFIANISHELKTPVATVKVALEALQKYELKNDPKVMAEYLALASRESVRLEELVGKVLQHQLLENPGNMIQRESVDLRQILSAARQSMEIPIRENNARLTVKAADHPCMVLADPVYLEGVIMNLVDNSLKYAGPRPELHVTIECTGPSTRLVVKDNGPGIPDAYKRQVFDKFFRIPAGDRHNVKGYGLGLNFAAQVMSQIGGKISFQNLKDGGCEFILEFPKNP
ncbi:MAG: sensor histidine kinase [Bacteroidales bacterium]